eukprot:TRINITY_DN7195_c0_g2_i1.p1 TRINITY_DN7195_c0_g2~~TRINITY_DN7195_c0_g2_i1.p1  ORF type:complete len:646 (-),score=94.18 TRINITY_DN7195_c0_g2_i1:89-2026(-)
MPGRILGNPKRVSIFQTTASLSSMAERTSLTGNDWASSLSNPTDMVLQVRPQANECTRLSLTNQEKDLFEKMLTACLNEVPELRKRPRPVILGPSKPVDLYELFNIVKKRGGFDMISSKKLWSSVSAELGFNPELGPSLKLVYSKYLKLFDRWVQRAEDVNKSRLSSDNQDVRSNGGKSCFPHTGESYVTSQVSPLNETGQLESALVIIDDDDDDEQTSCTPKVAKKPNGDVLDSFKGKRKRDTLNGVLDWIKNLAKDPCNAISKKHEKSFQDFLLQSSELRKLLFVPISGTISENGTNSQKRLKVHPSLYESPPASAVPNPEALERLRSFDKRKSSTNGQKSPSPSPSETSSALGNQVRGPSAPAVVKLSPRTNFMLYLERAPRSRIRLGPLHQALVKTLPTCTDQSKSGSVSTIQSAEDRLLGTMVWPAEGERGAVNEDKLGKGRPDSCGCQYPGSVECVRLHIQREREKLATELGSLFTIWGFNDMGEDVSRSWSKEEECRFRAVVRLNPMSLGNDFWNELPVAFPSKSREVCVSYYFNVFVLRRRSIQNRVMPEQIDSDDDEVEYNLVNNLGVHKGSAAGRSEGSSRGHYLLPSAATEVCNENQQVHVLEGGSSAKPSKAIPNGNSVIKQQIIPCLSITRQ